MIPAIEQERFRRESAAQLRVLEGPPAVEVNIPIRTRNRANNSQGISRSAVLRQAQERRAARGIVRLCLAPRRAPALPCIVVLHRVGTTTRLDTDGLAQALKGVRDEVAAWLGLPTNKRGQADDADPRVTWLYSQETAGRDHAVKIGVWNA